MSARRRHRLAGLAVLATLGLGCVLVTASVDEPPPGPGRGAVVRRVVDGDTVVLAGGERVRLVGMDAPETGECGHDRATALLTRLVEGRRVTLVRAGVDRDRYGRLLRYVDIDRTDAGLRLIEEGLAVARYDSRDGYGRHPRERRYVAADRRAGAVRCP